MRSTALLVLCPALALAQVSVSVDTGADVHPISPLIYGINFAPDADVVAGRLTLTRWGGNGTTRYNWQIDTTNTGADYFFENIPGCWNVAGNYCSPVPSDPRSNSGANALLGAAKTRGIATLFTVPVMGWVAATAKYAHPFDCGCPKSLVAAQDAFDPYDPGCGNGLSGGVHVQSQRHRDQHRLWGDGCAELGLGARHPLRGVERDAHLPARQRARALEQHPLRRPPRGHDLRRAVDQVA